MRMIYGDIGDYFCIYNIGISISVLLYCFGLVMSKSGEVIGMLLML